MVQPNPRGRPIKHNRSRPRRLIDPRRWLGSDRIRLKSRTNTIALKRIRSSQNGAPISSNNCQCKHSAPRWDFRSHNLIALLTIVTVIVALVFGISSWYYQSRGDNRAEVDSRAVTESNRLAAENNRLAMWQICKSEKEFQDTRTCTELLKSGPFSPGKGDVSRRVSVPELEYPGDSESSISHHELLVHLLTRRLQLGRQLGDLQIKTERPNHLDNSPDTGIRMQLKDTANWISQSESHILTLLLLATSAKEAKEDLTPASHESKLEMSASYPISFDANIKGPRWTPRFKDLISLGTERLRLDFTKIRRILTNLIESPSEVRVSSPIGEIHVAPVISFLYTAYLGALTSLHLLGRVIPSLRFGSPRLFLFALLRLYEMGLGFLSIFWIGLSLMLLLNGYWELGLLLIAPVSLVGGCGYLVAAVARKTYVGSKMSPK